MARARRRGREVSGLTERPVAHGYDFELVQHPLGVWFSAGFALVSLLIIAEIAELLSAWAFNGALVGLLAVWWFGMAFRRVVQLEVVADEVRVRGWLGRIPFPGRLVLPAANTALSYRAGPVLNGVRYWSLTIENGEQRRTLRMVACTEEEVERIRRTLQEVQATAQARHGSGQAEVPDRLAALRDRSRSEVDRV